MRDRQRFHRLRWLLLVIAGIGGGAFAVREALTIGAQPDGRIVIPTGRTFSLGIARDEPDEAPADLLNRAIWYPVKGGDAPPRPRPASAARSDVFGVAPAPGWILTAREGGTGPGSSGGRTTT